MFQFQYTCELIGPDGKLIQVKSFGFFHTSEIFVKLLESWSGTPGPNGGTYRYFQDEEDYRMNPNDKKPIPEGFRFENFATLFMVPNSAHHSNIFVSPGDIWGKL